MQFSHLINTHSLNIMQSTKRKQDRKFHRQDDIILELNCELRLGWVEACWLLERKSSRHLSCLMMETKKSQAQLGITCSGIGKVLCGWSCACVLGVGCEVLWAQDMKKLICHIKELWFTLELWAYTQVPGDEDEWTWSSPEMFTD